MPNKIIADSFETLGSAVQQGGKQAVSTIKKMGEDVLEQTGIKAPSPAQNDQTAAPAQTEEQYRMIDKQSKKIENAAEKRTIARYREVQAQIKAIGDKRKQELPKEITGKPGFDEGKAIKQLEEGGAASVKTSASQGKKLPPINVQRERTKAERFRGASG